MLPLPLLLIIIALGLALVWFSRFQKSGKTLITLGWFVLLLLSLQPVADGLLRPIENKYPTWQGNQKVAYIVVLGGGYTWNHSACRVPQLSLSTAQKIPKKRLPQ